jgi:DNA-binding transcriptional regulator PaaX
MRNEPFRARNNGERRVTPGALVLEECHGMIRQMALPLISERRVKGALSAVSRESGISYSKLRKIYYRLTDHILEFEFRSIAEAYKRHVRDHERKLEQELAELRALREARALREQHYVLDLETSAGAVAARQNTAAHA